MRIFLLHFDPSESRIVDLFEFEDESDARIAFAEMETEHFGTGHVVTLLGARSIEDLRGTWPNFFEPGLAEETLALAG